MTSIQRFLKPRTVQSQSIYRIPNSSWYEYNYVFGEKNVRDFGGEVFTVGVSPKQNFDCFLSANETASGYSFDIIALLAQILNFTAEFVEVDLSDPDVDLILCHPNAIPDGYVELRSTFTSDYAFVYKPSNLHFTKDIFILTFAGTLWLCFLVIFVALAFCLRISTIQYSRLHEDTRKWDWVEITLWAIAAPCQQGFSYTPKYFGSCLIFFVGYLTAYLLYTGFAAAITSVLLREDRTELNAAHLDNIKIALYGREDFHPYEVHKRVHTVRRIFEEIENRYTVGLCPKMLIEEFTLEKPKQFAFTALRNPRKYRAGFLLNERSARLKGPLNRGISALDENGLMDASLLRNLRRTGMDPIYTGYSSAGFEHVASAIYIFLAGALVALTFLLLELSLHLYKKYKYYQSQVSRQFE